MKNLVLYRKYRPQTFKEIIGQEHIVKTLSNAISRDMISHAYLFSGPRGSGKTTLARIFAKSINCHNRKEGEYEPCNKCNSCLEIMEGRSMDLIEIDAASNRGIDEIREIRDGIKFSPIKEKYKIFILDEAHQLSKEAFNALLKTLEEPPAHAIFILATTEIHKMIPTIISRCQRFDFRKLTMEEIVKRLEFICQKENIKIDKKALELIALNSQGAMRDAESLLDQVLTYAGVMKENEIIKVEDIKDLLGIVDINLISQFVDLLIEKKASEAVFFINNIFEKGYDLNEFVKSLISYLRQVMIMKINPEIINPIIIGLTKEEQEKIRIQASKFKEEELKNILNIFLNAENKMKYSPILQLPLELAVVEITLKKE
ncbi:MAG TPA: DNA polymerase III subunit gamma/tau [Candidatus Pacearchaeota archaeon]|nr:DNA polymerase III subunit gamma/tau [Candidatus Pacearchaeota archaeon]